MLVSKTDSTDSAYSENKCKGLYNFYTTMVMTSKIHAVNLTYGQVGHSHGLVDAGFGVISKKLRKEQVVTNYKSFTNILKNLHFYNLNQDRVSADDVNVLGPVLNFDRWLHDIGIEQKMEKIWNNMSKCRNIWITAKRNPDPTKPSMLVVIKNTSSATGNCVSPWISSCVTYVENEIKQAITNTCMYYDDLKYINLEKFKLEFQKWTQYNMMSETDLLSWNVLFDTMSSILNTSCLECAKLKQDLSMENSRVFQKSGTSQVCISFGLECSRLIF